MKNGIGLTLNLSCIIGTIIVLVLSAFGYPPGMWYLYLMAALGGILYPALAVCKIITEEN